MKYVKFTGIVIRGTDYLEHDRILTLLTFERGTVTVRAKGVRKKGAKLTFCADQFFCGSFECVLTKGRYVLTGARRLYDYSDVALDIEKYYHACHFIDIAASVIMEDYPNEEMLRLLLNTLHVLIKSTMDSVLLTAVYELRTAVLNGISPVTEECVLCGKNGCKMVFSYANQGMVCCSGGVEVSEDIIATIKHVNESEMKTLFSLRVSDKTAREIAGISRRYLEEGLDRRFNKLSVLEDMHKGDGK